MKFRFLVIGLGITIFIITGYITQARLSADEQEQVIRLVKDGRLCLNQWCESGFPDLEVFFRTNEHRSM